MPHLANLPLLVEVDQVDRKLHEKRMDRFARHDPQARAGLQPFVLEQADTTSFAGIRKFYRVTQDGVAARLGLNPPRPVRKRTVYEP